MFAGSNWGHGSNWGQVKCLRTLIACSGSGAAAFVRKASSKPGRFTYFPPYWGQVKCLPTLLVCSERPLFTSSGAE